MKKAFLFLWIFTLALASTSQANRIVNGGFENTAGVTSQNLVSVGTRSALPTPPAPVDIFADQAYAVGAGEGIWIAGKQWVRAQGVDSFNPDAPGGYSGKFFAYHAFRGGDHVDLLFQGFSAGTQRKGDSFSISFDYILADLEGNAFHPGFASVYIIGFGPGGAFRATLPGTYQFDSAAAPADFENYLAGTTDNVLVKDRLEPTVGWKRWSRSFILDKKYEALGVVFEFGVSSVDSFQGVDNVSVTAAVR